MSGPGAPGLQGLGHGQPAERGVAGGGAGLLVGCSGRRMALPAAAAGEWHWYWGRAAPAPVQGMQQQHYNNIAIQHVLSRHDVGWSCR